MTGWTENEFIVDGINAVEVGTRAFCELLEENQYQSPHYVYKFGGDIPGEDHPGAFHSLICGSFLRLLQNVGDRLQENIMIFPDRCVIIGLIL